MATFDLTGYGQSSLTNPIGPVAPSTTLNLPSVPVQSTTPSPTATVTPTVITPKAATDNLQGIQANLKQTQADITAQAQRVAADKAAADAKTAADAAAKTEADKAASEKAVNDAKAAALNGGYSPQMTNQLNRATDMVQSVVSNPDGTTSTVTYTDGQTQTIQGQFGTGSTAAKPSLQNSADTLSQKMLQRADETYKTIQDYQNGTIPLTPAEQAQVDELKRQFQKLISDQGLTNISAANTAATRGYQTGAAEYSNDFQNNIVNTIVSAGAQKIADLNVKMTSAVAQLEQGFRDNDIKAIQEANTAYQDAAKFRLDEINKQLDQVNQVAKDAATAKKDAQDKLNSAKLDALKLGAPKELVQGAQSIDDLIKTAGDYMQSQTGIIGEYNYYYRQAKAMGQTPMTFDEYQTRDANRKLSLARAGNGSAGNISNATLTKVEGIANQFDNEQVVKDYNTIATQVRNIESLGASPTDDIQRIYAFAKVADPTSAVREGEYRTIQEYSTALFQRAGIQLARVFDNQGFLTDEARQLMMDTLNNRLASQEKTYKNVYNEYGRRINKLTGGNDGTDYITDYSKGYPQADQTIAEENKARDTIKKYVGNDKVKGDEAQKYSDELQQVLGRQPTAAEFLQAYPKYKTPPVAQYIGGFGANLSGGFNF